MWKIAWCNLYRDKVRFGTAVVGLVFAVVLMAVQASIFLGAVESSSLLARSVDADLWVVPLGTANADFAFPMVSRRRYQALGIPGVERTGRMGVGFGIYKFGTGRHEGVIVIGTDTDHAWLPVDANLLKQRTAKGHAVVLDNRERYRFGDNGRLLQIGDTAEIRGHRVYVAGFVEDMASFTVTPYVFTSYKAALDLTWLRAGLTTFVLVKCKPGADVEAVRHMLQRRIPDVEVLNRPEFADRCWKYWVYGTGMGFSLILMAALALIVGMTIVGQTFVTGVLVKIREYGTLKALGFKNAFVAGVIVVQGVIVALIGYVLGCMGTLVVDQFFGSGGTAVNMNMPPILFVALLPLTLLMCVTSSMAAAWRVFKLAPAEVFR
jgi:putative ABC transport system permease protein